jgi:hypothetical protein
VEIGRESRRTLYAFEHIRNNGPLRAQASTMHRAPKKSPLQAGHVFEVKPLKIEGGNKQCQCCKQDNMQYIHAIPFR